MALFSGVYIDAHWQWGEWVCMLSLFLLAILARYQLVGNSTTVGITCIYIEYLSLNLKAIIDVFYSIVKYML